MNSTSLIGTWHLHRQDGKTLPQEQLQSMSLLVNKFMGQLCYSGYLQRTELKQQHVSKINLPVFFQLHNAEKVLVLKTLNHKRIDELEVLSFTHSRLTVKSVANARILVFDKDTHRHPGV